MSESDNGKGGAPPKAAPGRKIATDSQNLANSMRNPRGSFEGGSVNKASDMRAPQPAKRAQAPQAKPAQNPVAPPPAGKRGGK